MRLPLIRMVIGLLFAVSLHAADFAYDVAKLHENAIGGRAAILALKALRVTGYTLIDGQHLDFTMWSARPNRVKLESGTAGLVMRQAYDGANPPWQFSSVMKKPELMSGEEARLLLADANFDDALVLAALGESHDVSISYRGEATWGDAKCLKIEVSSGLRDTSMLWVDAETFYIIRQDSTRLVGGREVTVSTLFGDYRAVAGVVLPHRIRVVSGEREMHETVLQTVVPNPALPSDAFAMPR